MCEICCSSRLQKAAPSPGSQVYGIPEGVGPEKGHLVAVLDHIADLVYLEPVTQHSCAWYSPLLGDGHLQINIRKDSFHLC